MLFTGLLVPTIGRAALSTLLEFGQVENQQVEINNLEGFWLRLLEVCNLTNFHGVGKQVADVTGLSSAAISKWRRGEGKPSFDNLIQIAKSTNSSIHWLLTGEGEKYVQPTGSKNVQPLALPGMRIETQSQIQNPPIIALVQQDVQLSSRGVMSVLTIHQAVEVSPLRLRQRQPDEVVIITIVDESFDESGYEAGEQLKAVPFAADEIQTGDLVVAQTDKQVFIRRYHWRGDQIALAPRFRHSGLPALFFFPDELQLLYRVVG